MFFAEYKAQIPTYADSLMLHSKIQILISIKEKISKTNP